MNMSFKYIIAGLAVVSLLSGCGKQHKAESIVSDFLDENLKSSDYSASFTKIDSTRLVSDSIVGVMRRSAEKNTSFKSGIKYDAEASQRMYIFTKAIIRLGDDTIRQTFYLTPDLKHVVSFKDN